MLSALTTGDLERLEAQRRVVRHELHARYGETLRPDRGGLDQLQLLLDDQAFGPRQRYELQAIGVCFGDVLCAIAPFRWMMITDDFGYDPTLQWKDTTINIHALTLISKRIEQGEDVDVTWLADQLIKRAQALEAEGQ